MNFVDRYFSAVDLCYVQSENDPEENPYKSKYEARRIFDELRQVELFDVDEQIGKHFENVMIQSNENDELFVPDTNLTSSQTPLVKYKVLVRLIIDFHVGSILTETDERSEGEIILRQVLKSIEQTLPHALFNILALKVLNQLILNRTSFENYDEAIELCQRVEQIYEQSSAIDPFSFEDLIHFNQTNQNRREQFDDLYTHTLFYLAQIYGKKQNKDQSAFYCRLTLERQLKLFERKSNKFDALDWATNCATLSQYFITSEHDYRTARYCLLCADFMLTFVDSSNEKLQERAASFKRCWIKYALNLLADSSDRLLQAADRDVDPNKIIRSSTKPKFQFSLTVSDETKLVTSDFVLDFEQARPVFLFAMDRVREAKEFFLLDGFVSDHVEICQDVSQLYLKLMFFEEKVDRKCKMHKRRIDILSDLCDQISEEHYINLVRQLRFELAETYSQLLDLKIEEKNSSNTDKVQRLIEQGIQAFNNFLISMHDKKTHKEPETYADECVRAALLAHFYLARLHSKATNDRLEHLKESLEQYKIIIDYVDRHPQTRACIEQEYSICKEMIELLPFKIEQIRKISD